MNSVRSGARIAAALLSIIATLTPALGQETIGYSYDSRGRLVQVSHSGAVNNGVLSSYTYDAADNRTNVTVSTAGTTDCTGISFSISSNGPVTEGSNSVFTITKTGSTAASCSVSYTTASGTAVSGSDFTAKSGTLTFTSAQSSLTVSVPTTDDTTVESAETFTVTLSNPTPPATITTATATATINDNDSANTCNGVSFNIASNGAVTEGASSAFTVSKSGTTSNSCSVSYATASGTATSGSDFTAKSGTLAFTSTQTSQTVTVATIDDAIVESAETFAMNLSSPTGGATLGAPSSATATINDNDANSCSGVSFSVDSPSDSEGAPLTFTISKTGGTAATCTVKYATADGTAVAGTNYQAVALATASFAPTVTTVQVTVTTYDDGVYHAINKYLYLNLSSPSSGATLTNTQGKGTLLEADPNGCPLC